MEIGRKFLVVFTVSQRIASTPFPCLFDDLIVVYFSLLSHRLQECPQGSTRNTCCAT